MELTENFLNQLKSQPTQPFQKVLVSNSFLITKDTELVNSHSFLFNNDLDIKLPITDQKSSGRCWIFAALNMIRHVTQQNWKDEHEISDLEFSQTYLYFWDKLERYHRSLYYFLDIMKIQNNFEREQYLMQLNKDPMGDGGQWSMIADLIKKYGIVPKKIMPDTFHSKNSGNMNNFLTNKLKNDFIKLSTSAHDLHEELIEMMMTRTYNYLVGFLGKPPQTFEFTFKNKNKVETMKDLTPLAFLKKTGFNPDDYISLVNDPRKENPYFEKYQVKYLGNVHDSHVNWINVPIDRLKELTKKSIDEKKAVWFGCDVGAEHDRDTGIHDVGMYDTKTFMNAKFTMTKEEKLRFYASVPSHAMVITGYHEDDNIIKRWKIENSWGSSSGTNGHQLMSDKWFDEYVYQITVHKDLLNDKEKDVTVKIPRVIQPWDPLGTLA
jgi:bleomycin hydrolase